jgi:hypothetical protein
MLKNHAILEVVKNRQYTPERVLLGPFQTPVGIENLIRPVGFFSMAVPSFTSARRWRRLG